MPIGVAIIGSGIFVKESHLPAVLSNPNYTLKAIYSRSLKSASALDIKDPQNISIYSDDSGPGKTYSDLLSRPDITALIIALPILSQPTYIRAALLAGKHVLSEKPIAKDLETAKELIEWYRKSGEVAKGATWSVAENFRFLDSFLAAKEEIGKLGGKVTGFRVKLFTNVQGGKYFETEWRKVPEYQGGFLLDGGVHFVAGIRLLLGSEAKPAKLTAYTTLLQPHLPPVDTVDSIWRTESGVSGTFSVSFGTLFKGMEFAVALEKGSVTIRRDPKDMKVVVETSEGKTEEKSFMDEGAGVPEESAAWAEALLKGEANPMQSPEEALADLEILEQMLKSGETDGEAKTLQYQL